MALWQGKKTTRVTKFHGESFLRFYSVTYARIIGWTFDSDSAFCRVTSVLAVSRAPPWVADVLKTSQLWITCACMCDTIEPMFLSPASCHFPALKQSPQRCGFFGWPVISWPCDTCWLTTRVASDSVASLVYTCKWCQAARMRTYSSFITRMSPSHRFNTFSCVPTN